MKTRCRECNDPIMFVRLESGGRLMPIDPFPDPDGNVYARYTTTPGGLLGYVAKEDQPLPEGWRIYMPHFATCPMRTSTSDPSEPAATACVEDDPEPTLFDQPTEGN